MKVVFLGTNDWANWANCNARAINRANKPDELQARVVTQHIHPFQYREDLVLDRGNEVQAAEVVQAADILVTTGDGDYGGFDAMRAALGGSGKPVAACHVGSAYRDSVDAYNAEDKARGWRRRFVSPDLYRFVKDDPDARIHFVPNDFITTHLPPRPSSTLRVLHGPSTPARKGTEEVERACKAATLADPRIVCKTITGESSDFFWQRMWDYEVFVDALPPCTGGIGGSSQGAMSFGLVTISDTSNICRETYRWMTPPPVLHAYDARGLTTHLTYLASYPESVEELRMQSVAWARHHLSADALFAYWKEHLCW